MKLYYSPSSPYVRKVVVTAHEKGLFPRLRLIPTAVNPLVPNLDLARDNPLMKLPTLVTDEGLTLFDSSLICEYLDALQSNVPQLLPSTGNARWQVLRLENIADGILEAGLLLRYEQLTRPETQRSDAWQAGQATKIRQGLDLLEQEVSQFAESRTLGTIAVGCALGWLEFRMPIGEMRSARPRVFAWWDKLQTRPAFATTTPVG